MADAQDRPDSGPDDTSTPQAKTAPAQKAARDSAEKAHAEKAPAKKTPANKAPTQSPEPAPPRIAEAPLSVQQRNESNGKLLSAAKDAAAQAKSTVEGANNPVSPDTSIPAPSHSALPLMVAAGLSLLALILVRQLRRR